MKKIFLTTFFIFFVAFFLFGKDPYFFIRVNSGSDFTNFILNSNEMNEFVKSPSYDYFSTTRIYLKLKRRIKKYSGFTGIKFGRDFLKSITGKNVFIWCYDFSDTIFVYESDVENFLNTPISTYISKKFKFEDFNGKKIFFLKKGKLTFALIYSNGHLFISNSLVRLKQILVKFSTFSPKKFYISNCAENEIYSIYLNLKLIKKTPHFRKYYRFKGEYKNYENGLITLYRTNYGFCEKRIFFNKNLEDVTLPEVTFLTDKNISVIREERGALMDLIEKNIFEVNSFPESIKFSVNKKSGEFTLLDKGVVKIGEASEDTEFNKSLMGVSQILSMFSIRKLFYISKLEEIKESLKWHSSKNGILVILRDKVGDDELQKIAKLLCRATGAFYLIGDVKIKNLGNTYLINPVDVGKNIYLERLGDSSILISDGKFNLSGEKVKIFSGLNKNIFEIDISDLRNFFKRYSPVIEGGNGTIFYDVLPSLFDLLKRVEKIQVLKYFNGDEEVVFGIYKISQK